MLTSDNATSTTEPAWHAGFLVLLPALFDQVRFAFRAMQPEARQDAVQESLANAAVAYARLHERGKADIAYATPLARYAVRQYRAGRRVGSELNRNDVMSKNCQKYHGVRVERLDRRDPSGAWKEILVEDKTCTPAETAIARIDFGDWLSRLCQRDRGIATTLAAGETGRNTAKLYGISDGRVTQLRGELKRNWQVFQGERVDEASELAMAGC